MNRIALLLLCLGTSLLPACGEEEESAGKRPAKSEPSPDREALLQTLFEADSPAALESASAAARRGGISEQSLLEARFLFLVDQEDYPAIAALSPELVKRRDQFRLEDSAIFAVPEDWLAVVEYSRALAALERDDPEGFKRHIMEAFWFSPRQAAAFAPHIERLRLEKAMAGVRLDFNQRLFTQDSRRPTSLADLAGDSRHVLLHFWSPWSEECEAYFPDFLVTAKHLGDHGIRVVSVLAELSPDVLPDAATFRTAAVDKCPAAWVLENEPEPLGRLLRIQNLPTAVLVDRGGSVLFNGHPADARLWDELREIKPEIVRPDLPPAAPEHAPEPAK